MAMSREHGNKKPRPGITNSWCSELPWFIDDHTAYMTGVVTQKVGDVFPGEYEVGMPVWFKVRDNGEGDNSNADEFTDYYSLQGIECINYEQASMHPIISGASGVNR